jgi:hypothetical protein
MSDDTPKMSSVLREIAGDKDWSPEEFLNALLKVIDSMDADLTDEQSRKLIDVLDESE